MEGELGQAEEGGVPDDTHPASLDASDDSGSIGLVVCACEGAGGMMLLVMKCLVAFAREFVWKQAKAYMLTSDTWRYITA